MPTAKKLPSGSWRCRIYSHSESIKLPDGTIKQKKIYKSFTCDNPKQEGKRLCERKAAEWAASKEKSNPEYYAMTFKQALKKYIETKSNVLSQSTIRGYETLQRNSFDLINEVKLCDLDTSKLQAWINEFSVKHSPKTVSNAYGLVNATVNFFLPEFHVRVKLPMRTKPDLYTPSDDDVKKLISAIKGTDMEIAVYLAAFGAMRRGEICALTDKDIHGNTATINKAIVRGQKGMVVKTPKTTSSYRTVQLPEFVIDRISGIEGRIVKMHPEDISKNFGGILSNAGLPHFRFHDLRHYAASIMHAIGIPDQYIMEMGGWKSDRVLKAVYRNTIEDEKKKFTDKITSHFEQMQE